MVGDLWWWIGPLVDRLVARAHGEFTSEQLKSRAASGEILLWAVSSPAHRDAPLATLAVRLEDWSGETVARVYGAAGSLAAIQATAEEGYRRMKELGATRIVFEGRFGWERALKDFRPMKIVMERKL